MAADRTNSIVPQIKDQAEHTFLQNLAFEVHEESHFKDPRDVKNQVVSEILTLAISQAPINEPLEPSHSRHGTCRFNTNYEVAKSYLQSCLGTFDSLVGLIVDKVIDTRLFAAPEAERQTKEVMLPLLELIVEYMQKHPSASIPPGVDKLLRVTVDAYMKSIAACPEGIIEENVHELVRTITLPGGQELFMAR